MEAETEYFVVDKCFFFSSLITERSRTVDSEEVVVAPQDSVSVLQLRLLGNLRSVYVGTGVGKRF